MRNTELFLLHHQMGSKRGRGIKKQKGTNKQQQLQKQLKIETGKTKNSKILGSATEHVWSGQRKKKLLQKQKFLRRIKLNVFSVLGRCDNHYASRWNITLDQHSIFSQQITVSPTFPQHSTNNYANCAMEMLQMLQISLKNTIIRCKLLSLDSKKNFSIVAGNAFLCFLLENWKNN